MTVAQNTTVLNNTKERGGIVITNGVMAVTGMIAVTYLMITVTLHVQILISMATIREETARPSYGIKNPSSRYCNIKYADMKIRPPQ